MVTKGPKPSFYPGDLVVVETFPKEGPKYLEGQEGTVVENIGRLKRKEGKKITFALYQVHFPALGKDVNVKGRYLRLVPPTKEQAAVEWPSRRGPDPDYGEGAFTDLGEALTFASRTGGVAERSPMGTYVIKYPKGTKSI